MGLLYQKKNDENEDDGKTALFTDFFTAPPASDGCDLEHTKNTDEKKPSEQEEELQHGKKEQQ